MSTNNNISINNQELNNNRNSINTQIVNIIAQVDLKMISRDLHTNNRISHPKTNIHKTNLKTTNNTMRHKMT